MLHMTDLDDSRSLFVMSVVEESLYIPDGQRDGVEAEFSDYAHNVYPIVWELLLFIKLGYVCIHPIDMDTMGKIFSVFMYL